VKNAHLLNQCDEQLRVLFQRVDRVIPVEILPSTIRTLEQQKKFFAAGTSKTMNSKHLITPEHPLSRAVDAGPYPHVWPQEGSKDFWKDWGRLYYFAGMVVAIGRELGLDVRYGGDWNGNFDLKDENFYDGVHFEIRGL
jgi:peptidoglycan L-alanyl-D-glutamate endopeptidase CwlK